MSRHRHVPVLLDRVVALLAPALERARAPSLVDATLGHGWAHRGAARAPARRPRSSASTATRRRSRSAGDRLAPYADRTTLVHAVYDEIRDVLAGSASTSVAGRAVRPRRLVAAARRGATAASPTRRTRRSTCGWTRTTGHDGRRGAQHLLRRRSSPASCARYGEERFARASPRASSASASTAPVRHQRSAGRAGPRRDPGRRPAYRRQPRQAHVPGPADRGQRRARRPRARVARPRSTPSPSEAGSS